MSESKTSYPLCWPDGWPRTPIEKVGPSRFRSSVRVASQFYGGKRDHSMPQVCDTLYHELKLLGVPDYEAILSTNIPTKRNGYPYAGQSQPLDRGAAVFFKLDGKDTHLACDRWNRVECNVWAIAKHIEALRGQDRWGVGTIAQAFRGYMAIPERSGGIDPLQVLGLKPGASESEIIRAYKNLAKQFHPDMPGGSESKFNEIKTAADFALAAFRK